MENIVVTLGAGVFLVTALFFLLYRLTRLNGYQTAGLVLALTLLIFIPYSVLNWAGADVFALHFALYVIVPYGLGMITTQLEGETGAKARVGRLHWFPVTLIVFFGIVATVNATLLTWATKGMPPGLVGVFLPEPQSRASHVTSGFPGTVARISERKEALAVPYFERIERQTALGWQVQQGWRSRPEMNQPAVFQVRLTDRDGRPLSNAVVQGDFMRVSDFRLDQRIQLAPVGQGFYEAVVILPAPGRWDLLLTIEHGGERFEQQASTRVRELRS